MMYEVWFRDTYIRSRKTSKAAYALANKLDAEYGASVHVVRFNPDSKFHTH
jgi:hypothetical protein